MKVNFGSSILQSSINVTIAKQKQATMLDGMLRFTGSTLKKLHLSEESRIRTVVPGLCAGRCEIYASEHE